MLILTSILSDLTFLLQRLVSLFSCHILPAAFKHFRYSFSNEFVGLKKSFAGARKRVIDVPYICGLQIHVRTHALRYWARSQICGKRLLVWSCLCVRPRGTTRLPLDGFS